MAYYVAQIGTTLMILRTGSRLLSTPLTTIHSTTQLHPKPKPEPTLKSEFEIQTEEVVGFWGPQRSALTYVLYITSEVILQTVITVLLYRGRVKIETSYPSIYIM